MGNSKLINGDCLEELKKVDDDSVDLLCTDPPYGYGFMGKHWDTFQEKKSTKSQSVGWMSPGMKKSTYGMKEFFNPIWEEALRVLKPGSFAFVMSAPRSDVQMVMLQTLQESGFDVSFTPIYWTYATGFPKALNIGKAVDKRLNKKRKVVGKREHPTLKDKSKIREPKSATHSKDTTWDREWNITEPKSDEAKKLDGSYAGYQPKPAVEVIIVAMKPLGKKKGYVDQALDNGKGVTWLDDCRIPFSDMSDEEQFEKDNVAGHQKFIEKRKDEMYGGGWDKPARNSKSDTYERVSAFGDSKQSETKDGRNLWGKKATKKVKITKRQPRTDHNVFKQSGFKSEENDTAEASPLGRFAANLLVSDDVLNVKSKGQLAPTTGKEPSNYKENNTHGSYLGYRKEMTPRDDGDSFSRYYSLDAWWEDRVQKLPEEIQRTFPFLIVPKASKSEKNSGLDKLPKKKKLHSSGDNHVMNEICPAHKITLCPCGWRSPKVSNFHPTVKPIDLMSYLVVLGSRKGDVVLDPFSGSGTTGIACVFSERNYILIEREKEYFKIMEARIKKAKNPAGLVENEWF
jgi:DNA modification methylase